MNPTLGYQCLSLIAWGQEWPNSVFPFAYLFGCLCTSVVAICLCLAVFLYLLFFCDVAEVLSLKVHLLWLTHWGRNFMRWWALIILLDFWQSCAFAASLRCIKLCHRVAFHLKKSFPIFVILTKLVLLYFISQTSLELFSLQAWKCITKFLPF